MLHRVLNGQGWKIAALIFASIALYLISARNQFLSGTDAYYYALQADTWARTGDVKIPDSSLIHRIIGLLQCSGLSTEVAVRGWIAISVFFAGLMFLMLVCRTRRLEYQWLLLGWFLVSPSVLFNALEFPKLFMAVATFPLSLYLAKQGSRFVWLAILLSWTSVLLHRAMAPVALLFTIAILCRQRRNSRQILGILALTAVSAAVVFWIWPNRLGLRDVQFVGAENVRFGVVSLFSRASLPIAIKVEIVVCFALWLYVLFRGTKENGSKIELAGLATLSVLPFVVPSPSSEALGMGERFALLAPWLHMVLAASFLRRSQETGIIRVSRHTWIAIAALVVAITPFRFAYSHPQDLDPPWPVYERIVQSLKPMEIPMLIAHRGLNFFYKFRLRREAFGYEPEPHWDKSRVWRLGWGISPDELQYGLTPECRWNESVKALPERDYILIREDCWRKFRASVDPKSNPDLYFRLWKTWQNPSAKRPSHLYVKHQADAVSEFPALEDQAQ